MVGRGYVTHKTHWMGLKGWTDQGFRWMDGCDKKANMYRNSI